MLMVVVAVVGVISLTSLALAQVAATRLDQARNEAIADFVALAAVQNRLDAGRVADANGGELLRITRGADYQSLNVRGLYPAGEGAGYAGGILSAGVDGGGIPSGGHHPLAAREHSGGLVALPPGG